jgi:hypothetical protein
VNRAGILSCISRVVWLFMLGLIRFGVGFSGLLFSGTVDWGKYSFYGLVEKFCGATNHKT